MNIPKNREIDACQLLNIENSLLGVLYFQHILKEQFSYSLPDFIKYIGMIYMHYF